MTNVLFAPGALFPPSLSILCLTHPVPRRCRPAGPFNHDHVYRVSRTSHKSEASTQTCASSPWATGTPSLISHGALASGRVRRGGRPCQSFYKRRRHRSRRAGSSRSRACPWAGESRHGVTGGAQRRPHPGRCRRPRGGRSHRQTSLGGRA